jgi:hypothetical protein
MKIVCIRFLPTGQPHALNSVGVGQMGVTRIEEVMLPGPNGPMPYIRIHDEWDRITDLPKHNLEAITYQA